MHHAIHAIIATRIERIVFEDELDVLPMVGQNHRIDSGGPLASRTKKVAEFDDLHRSMGWTQGGIAIHRYFDARLAGQVNGLPTAR